MFWTTGCCAVNEIQGKNTYMYFCEIHVRICTCNLTFPINTKWWYISQLLPHESNITNCSRTQGLSAISTHSHAPCLQGHCMWLSKAGFSWVALLQAAAQLIYYGLGTHQRTCVPSEVQADGAAAIRACSSQSGPPPPPSISRSSFKASILVTSITSLIGPGSWFLPKGKGEKCEQTVTRYHG